MQTHPHRSHYVTNLFTFQLQPFTSLHTYPSTHSNFPFPGENRDSKQNINMFPLPILPPFHSILTHQGGAKRASSSAQG